MLEFSASTEFDGVQDEVQMLGFSETADGDGAYILIQWQNSYDQQDIDLKQNAPHIEVCEQGYSQYGGLKGISIEEKKIVFEFLAGTPIGDTFGRISVCLDRNSKDFVDSLSRAFGMEIFTN